jgi:hypothetical protein
VIFKITGICLKKQFWTYLTLGFSTTIPALVTDYHPKIFSNLASISQNIREYRRLHAMPHRAESELCAMRSRNRDWHTIRSVFSFKPAKATVQLKSGIGDLAYPMTVL